MNYFSDTPNPETQLSNDGNGAGFKVGKVKLHFEVHGLAFSIISVLAINKHEPHSGYSVWTSLHQKICIREGPDCIARVWLMLVDGKH